MAERVFNLPDLGEGLEDAEIVEWKVSEGDTVALNQPLVDVNTAKALVEIPSPFAGKIVTLHGADGDVVKVGDPLITIDVEGAESPVAKPVAVEAPSEGEAPKREAVLVGYGVDPAAAAKRTRPRLRPPGQRMAPAARADTAPSPDPVSTVPAGRVAAPPPVRRLAKEMGVDLTVVRGTGPSGRVTREDVIKAAGTERRPAAGSEPSMGMPAFTGPEERVPVRGVRRMIAQKMARSWAEIPHVTTFHLVDATHVEAFRRELTAQSGVKVTALPVVVRALAEICRDHPKLNSSYDMDAGELVLKKACHVGIATDTDQGLVVPVVRDAGDKNVISLAREIADLVEASRERRATPEQLTGGTITVTNVGTFGSEYGTPIINFPEVAILAIGTIKPRALVVDAEVAVRSAVTLALSFDHRVIDGAEADRAMSALRELLESPFRLGALPRE
jgi:pyruvate/2-oxoglutarate dehydrogenase complex dihydrolipoamide acyltransferase (E2) component